MATNTPSSIELGDLRGEDEPGARHGVRAATNLTEVPDDARDVKRCRDVSDTACNAARR